MYATITVGDGGARLARWGVPPPTGRGKRGSIWGFSKASRRRLVDKLMLVPWSEMPGQGQASTTARACMLTLTYPSEFPERVSTTKNHLDNFHRALHHTTEKEFSALWRLEFQKRGAPHYHILMFFNEPIRITSFQNWALKTWARVVGSDDPKHERHGADVRALKVDKSRPGKLMCYLVKYLTKLDDNHEHTGRMWGEWGNIPQAVRAAVTFETQGGFARLLRRIRKWGKRSPYLRRLSNIQGARLFNLGVDGVMQLCRELVGCDVFVT